MFKYIGYILLGILCWPGLLVIFLANKFKHGFVRFNWPCAFVWSLMFFYIPLAWILEEMYIK